MNGYFRGLLFLGQKDRKGKEGGDDGDYGHGFCDKPLDLFTGKEIANIKNGNNGKDEGQEQRTQFQDRQYLFKHDLLLG